MNPPRRCFGFSRQRRFGSLLLILLAASLSTPAHSAPNMMGQTGVIAMPDGRMDPDGTWRIGVSDSYPYLPGWMSVTLLPRLEFSARYTRIANVPGFVGAKAYGNFKDKAFDIKLLLNKESTFLPAVSIGKQDILGTRIFGAEYAAASKRLGPVDISAGVGRGRIDGPFGGLRYTPSPYPNWAFVAEYDANNYAQDIFADQSGAAQRKKGVSVGVEYNAFGWLHTQLSRQDHATGMMAYLSIPLNRKEFIPKIDEPPAYLKITPRPKLQEWLDDPRHRRTLIAELERQDFKNIKVTSVGTRLNVVLTNSRISLMTRAIGRAARIILLLSPVETREIQITYTTSDLPVATYTFFDLSKLRYYFAKKISRKELADYVIIEYASPYAAPATVADDDTSAMDMPVVANVTRRLSYKNQDGDFISYKQEDSLLNKIVVVPKMALFFNDPSGFLHYLLYLHASYEKHLGDKLYLLAAADGTLLEDVSKVTQPSNSALPHVVSDIADYLKGSKVKLSRLVVNKYFHPDTGVYARASVGLYEMMYAGTGGQILYASPRGQWAADFTVDWLKQRDTFGGFGFRPYSTVTALAALHYKLPLGVTGTVRAGRFLAKDVGARFELKRRFASGFEMGGWYTLTNGNDITSPGSPSKPYHDKGIFLSMPFNAFLTADTQARGDFALAPWTRDVGQMVGSPGDLYDLLEKPMFQDLHDQDGLARLAGRNDDYAMQPAAPNLFERAWLKTAKSDMSNSWDTLKSSTTWRAVGLGLGVTAASALLDKPADNFAQKHGEGRIGSKLTSVGDALPFVAVAASGVLAMNTSDARLNNTAYIALQAGAAAAAIGAATKLAVGRSRPIDNVGGADFQTFKLKAGSSFPSLHTSLIWGVVTPYAKEYDMPWLYGVAAVTNAARVMGRAHWVSDTVAGSLLGYAAGSLLWNWQRDLDGNSPRVTLDQNGIKLSWATR